MSAYVLWRRLTETDLNAMHGRASPHGRGGGAMHVALGVRTNAFPIDEFLGAAGRRNITIRATTIAGAVAPLAFASNPGRRGGEWLIRDQFTHRHPAWSSASGFPEAYSPANPPYLLIVRVGKVFHARFVFANRIRALGIDDLEILSRPKGIGSLPPAMMALVSVKPETLLEQFESQEADNVSDGFDPADVPDGRNRILTAIFRRLGQQSFRKKLLSAYIGQCAISRCTTAWVLEAAHITPYRGMKTNAVTNGLLLRADVHTLFDLGLISIEPQRYRICVSQRLMGSDMGHSMGEPLSCQ